MSFNDAFAEYEFLHDDIDPHALEPFAFLEPGRRTPTGAGAPFASPFGEMANGPVDHAGQADAGDRRLGRSNGTHRPDLDAGFDLGVGPLPGPDVEGEAVPETAEDEPRTTADRLRRSGATAAMFTALALAYREVFEPEKTDGLVLEMATDEPFGDVPVEFVMVPGNPRASRIIIRRWLSR